MSPETYRNATCYVHAGPAIDTRLLHEHHKHPQGYGGAVDDPHNLVWLCGSCHDLVHRLANFTRSGKQGLVSDLAQQYQAAQNLSPAGKNRLLELVQLAAKYMEDYIPTEAEDLEHEDTVMVQLKLPRSVHTKAKLLAGQYKNPGSKRSMGLYRYLTTVVVNHVHLMTNAPVRGKDPNKVFMTEGEGTPAIAEVPKDMGDLIPIE